ncbi:MAG: tRNA (adenosine(37)-N6)-threonylcarbamoyltransferase complex transferase subunit TsaD [Candidatus Magasanikbacteria bacterium RIFOXYD2_FULL_41_14]|uniref:tRNA N6-adenosine threonylcarbamoyltransferase n=1 Tax=Candidatus Magasanikbacteria bacterium RIFOXYD2_FULL_41_14 TaxID=1798709 RepID=A0A1F6PG35_9BACT|nr:MAG: tRNA (adenosine(37)-N6)-threonylcarbamoyltransferase complex transferase subunit TsaD [Candidatus Magasanikbacteria bacterium RIFOXYD2_FULL_41_14]
MFILGIESSCDDTSVALLDCSPKGCFVIKEVTASQIDLHKKYGGVVPELAGRAHAEKIVPLIEEVLRAPTLALPFLKREGNAVIPDAIAVTAGPGLITGLIVGVEAARILSLVWDVPLISVNHIWGHAHSVEICDTTALRHYNTATNEQNGQPEAEPKQLNSQTAKQLINYPALALIASGGHTELIFMAGPNDYEKIGATRDDAAGECFDKVAKLLELEYPGGPKISELAKTGRTDAIDFPRPMLKENNLDFSFSGLKTAALYWLRDNKLAGTIIASDRRERGNLWPTVMGLLRRFTPRNDKPSVNDFCASFEQAIVDVLVGKTLKAVKLHNPKTIILGGGVAANKKLRETLATAIAPTPSLSPSRAGGEMRLLIPNLKYCMDNAAMIAVAGYYQAQKKEFADWHTLVTNPNWEL